MINIKLKYIMFNILKFKIIGIIIEISISKIKLLFISLVINLITVLRMIL
jgi:hypothetical protein